METRPDAQPPQLNMWPKSLLLPNSQWKFILQQQLEHQLQIVPNHQPGQFPLPVPDEVPEETRQINMANKVLLRHREIPVFIVL